MSSLYIQSQLWASFKALHVRCTEQVSRKVIFFALGFKDCNAKRMLYLANGPRASKHPRCVVALRYVPQYCGTTQDDTFECIVNSVEFIEGQGSREYGELSRAQCLGLML